MTRIRCLETPLHVENVKSSLLSYDQICLREMGLMTNLSKCRVGKGQPGECCPQKYRQEKRPRQLSAHLCPLSTNLPRDETHGARFCNIRAGQRRFFRSPIPMAKWSSYQRVMLCLLHLEACEAEARSASATASMGDTQYIVVWLRHRHQLAKIIGKN